MSVFVPPAWKSRMLDVHEQTQAHLIHPSRCVAPSAIFWDYERVIARLQASDEGYDDMEFTETKALPYEGEINAASIQNPDHSEADDEHDEESEREVEYQEKPTRHAGKETSNTRSRRDIGSQRLARRQKPYMSRTCPPVAASTSYTRCPYVSPQNGARCKKLNRSSQEAGRHWRSCHLYKEAKAMLSGLLPPGKGTAITSEAQLREITPMIQCRVCSALITRSDAMRRHARTNCRAVEEREGTVVESRAQDSSSD